MSNKRITTESINDDQRNEEDFGLVFQPVDGVPRRANVDKRSRLSLLRDTTLLHDLPIKLLESILVEVVVMEVKSLKLSKSVWKENVDLVINRLANVCSQWNTVLTTNEFRMEVNRILDVTAEKTIRLEILHQRSIPMNVIKVITMKDEMFMLCRTDGPDYVINVYDRNNMADVKDVIPLQGLRPRGMAACSVSNCVYLLHMDRYGANMEWESLVVLCIARDEEQQFFNISGSFGIDSSPSAEMSVSADGNLMILSKKESPTESVVNIFDVNGSQLHDIKLLPETYGFKYIFNAILRPNGNLLLVSANDQSETMVSEIETTGRMVGQYRSSSLSGYSIGCLADECGRVLITDWRNGIELLDSQLNFLEFTGPRLSQELFFFAYDMLFDSDRSEIVRIDDTHNPNVTLLTIFRFAEE